MSLRDPGILFPPQLHVFVRDWLSANNVLLKSREGHVLVDSGYTRHAPLTLALLRSQRGLGGSPLADMPAYMERVGIFHDFNACFFRMTPAQLAGLLVDELEKSGAAARSDGWLMPAQA